MAHEFKHPIIGQEAICPDGLGRVVAFKDDFPHQWIQVDTYVKNRSCQWAPHNVQLAAVANLLGRLGNHGRVLTTLTCNQMILLLQIYRGTLENETEMGTRADDARRLLSLGLIENIDLQDYTVTAKGDQLVRCHVLRLIV